MLLQVMHMTSSGVQANSLYGLVPFIWWLQMQDSIIPLENKI